MAKRVSTQRIKKHWAYTYEDVAEILGLSVQTVRSWRSQGLHIMTERKPHLILGESLIEFIKTRQQKVRQQMTTQQMLCMCCKVPRSPLDMIVAYVPIAPGRGRIEGICEVCEGKLNRFVNEKNLPQLAELFDLVW